MTQESAPRRVLVIDDEPGVRGYVRRALDAAGYVVDEAAGGRIGIDLMDKAPDLVLLDLGLPDMSGEEVLRHIRTARPWVPVIVWTAGSDAHAEVRCRSLGSHAFLRKPLPLSTLLTSIGQVGRASPNAADTTRSGGFG